MGNLYNHPTNTSVKQIQKYLTPFITSELNDLGEIYVYRGEYNDLDHILI